MSVVMYIWVYECDVCSGFIWRLYDNHRSHSSGATYFFATKSLTGPELAKQARLVAN